MTSFQPTLPGKPTQMTPIRAADPLNVRIVNATTGELLRKLTIATNRDYQPKHTK